MNRPTHCFNQTLYLFLTRGTEKLFYLSIFIWIYYNGQMSSYGSQEKTFLHEKNSFKIILIVN